LPRNNFDTFGLVLAGLKSAASVGCLFHFCADHMHDVADWHIASFATLQRHGRYWGQSGRDADIAKPTRLMPKERIGLLSWRTFFKKNRAD
jgi:hypothetical protein